MLTFGMFGGYVAMFRGVFGARGAGPDRLARELPDHDGRPGGVADLRRGRRRRPRPAGVGAAPGRACASAWWPTRRSRFLVLTYFPYAAAVIVCGFGLRLGHLPRRGAVHDDASSRPSSRVHPDGASAGLILLVPTDLAAPAGRLRAAHRARVGRIAAEARDASPRRPPPACTTRSRHLRSRDPALLGAIAFWAFQIAVLWAAFQAFGDAPPLAVLIQAFFVGMLGNLLPIPGGVGGVEGGMIGAFAAFGVDAGLAVVAVLVFRAFTFWLPLLPGVIAFFRLRARSSMA